MNAFIQGITRAKDMEDKILAKVEDLHQRNPLLTLEEGEGSTRNGISNGFYRTGVYEGPKGTLQN